MRSRLVQDLASVVADGHALGRDHELHARLGDVGDLLDPGRVVGGDDEDQPIRGEGDRLLDEPLVEELLRILGARCRVDVRGAPSRICVASSSDPAKLYCGAGSIAGKTSVSEAAA